MNPKTQKTLKQFLLDIFFDAKQGRGMGRLLTNRIRRIRDIGPMEQCYKIVSLLLLCVTVFENKAINNGNIRIRINI